VSGGLLAGVDEESGVNTVEDVGGGGFAPDVGAWGGGDGEGVGGGHGAAGFVIAGQAL